VGNYVERGESNRLATISPLDPINVDFSISETLYLHTVSMVDHAALERIELILPDNNAYPFRGRYTNLARAVDAKTGTLAVQAQFPNPKGLLLPGMSGRVRVSFGTVPDAVLVSERAVFDVQGSKAVYVVTPESKVALRNIVSDAIYQGKSIVTKGLGGGETVIVDGIAKVRPGQRVTVQTAQTSRNR
jgi:membrane fusion protein (multidrug efflux system)